jgi:predicted ATPase with chaperone activity
MLSSGLGWPQRRMTVNLAPSGVRKIGASPDVAIAVGILVANDQLPADAVRGLAFVGELGLDGSLRRVPGLVPMVDALDSESVVVPMTGVAEAELVGRPAVGARRRCSRCSKPCRGWRRGPTRHAPFRPARRRSEVPISPMSEGSGSGGGPWRWRRPEATTS